MLSLGNTPNQKIWFITISVLVSQVAGDEVVVPDHLGPASEVAGEEQASAYLALVQVIHQV